MIENYTKYVDDLTEITREALVAVGIDPMNFKIIYLGLHGSLGEAFGDGHESHGVLEINNWKDMNPDFSYTTARITYHDIHTVGGKVGPRGRAQIVNLVATIAEKDRWFKHGY